ncbi:MAG: ATP-binding protein [bacterium]
MIERKYIDVTTETKVLIKGENKKICIDIEDNGCGFVVEKAFNPETRGISFGIMGIQERVKNFGGDFKITSEDGKGTKIALNIPVS